MGAIKPFRFIPTIKKEEYNNEFTDFVCLKSFFTPQELDKIRSLWSVEAAIEAGVHLSGKDYKSADIRKSQIMWIKPGANDWIYDKLGEACQQINIKRYKYDIKGFQTELQLANYEGDGFFEWHMDFGAGGLSSRKLSITVQLSDPTEYEGGELQFMINQNTVTAPKEKGTTIIFPSFILHRVTKVTSGSRKSIVGWIAGPPYR